MPRSVNRCTLVVIAPRIDFVNLLSFMLESVTPDTFQIISEPESSVVVVAFKSLGRFGSFVESIDTLRLIGEGNLACRRQ